MIADKLDVSPLLNAIGNHSYLWNQITERQTTAGSPHVDTKCIFLRWAEILTLDAVFNSIHAVDYPAMKELQEARPLIEKIISLVGGVELGRVIITSLKPGGIITPHADEGKYADHYERFHLPLKSEDGNWFFIGKPGGEKKEYDAIQMRPSELWAFDHKKTHWAVNNSDTQRLHLIVDCVAPLYRKERPLALSA